MDDCKSPKCREEILLSLKGKVTHTEFNGLKTCSGKKVSKRFMICLASPIAVLLGIGIIVWAGQESDHLRFMPIDGMDKYIEKQITQEQVLIHIKEDLAEIKDAQRAWQEENRKDMGEILRRLPGR